MAEPSNILEVVRLVTIVVGIGAPLHYGISWLSGWQAIARIHGVPRLPAGSEFSFQSAWFGMFGRYRNALTVVITNDGVGIVPWIILRFGHPPLFIPFTAMRTVRVEEALWVTSTVFEVAGRTVSLSGASGAALYSAWKQRR